MDICQLSIPPTNSAYLVPAFDEAEGCLLFVCRGWWVAERETTPLISPLARPSLRFTHDMIPPPYSHTKFLKLNIKLVCFDNFHLMLPAFLDFGH